MTKLKQKRPTHKWAIDQDYWDKLNEEERAWLLKFNNEYYKGKVGTSPIHPEHLRHDCYNRNNAMQRDAMVGALYMEEPSVGEAILQKNPEDNCQ